MNRWLPAIFIIVGFGVLYPLQRYIDTEMPKSSISEESLYFTSGKQIKQMSLGLDALTADIYWIRTVQYFGRKVIENGQPQSFGNTGTIKMQLLAPLLKIITELDPHHIPAYRFGAIFLPERDMNAAIELLNKGIEENPNEWRLYQDLGYIYWQNQEYQKAADAYERGSELPQAPWWMRDLVGYLRIKGGSREAARAIFERYVDSDDPKIREQAVARLNQLVSLDELDLINPILARYKQETGTCPDTLRMFAAKFKSLGLTLNKDYLPVDPWGFAYKLDPVNCKATIADESWVPRE
ncbi:MAG: hypothetical protein AB1757_11345 [Acidobacteriota bacterium]